ncbi:PTS sugar transporter subunit IIC [Rummeliibacillus sp. TYF005]|uniref:PTS transporter subunit IIC n=1 Tax=Rummeliibacillus sp. TYF005 TaxID=2058214 RepID=UPI000F52289B|nr:PTS sugar transporter subunit IIC [Rummeliibacillus sp. TYF005]RPJ94252.1 PTS sugar transporter subunit IIC [Rummeliibacillus sp. TYF005]
MKDFFNKLLTGMSIGIVVSLIPNALVGEIFKLLIPDAPFLQHILNLTIITMSMLPAMIGVTVGMTFKLTPIQTASVGLAAVVGSGVITMKDEIMTLSGIGVVLNTGITAALAVLFVQFIGVKLKDYTILLMPTLSIFVPGLIGYLLLPYVKTGTGVIGTGIQHVTTLQPVVMGAIIAVIFCILILSPLSTVGVATVIMLSGIGSGAANLGIVSAGVGLCIASYKVNSLGTALAHVLGSPKIQMRNFFMKPKMAFPMLITAAILGGLAGIFNIQGTPMSAGFGLSGLIGPLNYINLTADGWTTTNIMIMLTMFFILPILLNVVLLRLFERKYKIIEANDYKISIE